ncbi:hypothetical protein Peur_029083 [Populus x canadensis]
MQEMQALVNFLHVLNCSRIILHRNKENPLSPLRVSVYSYCFYFWPVLFDSRTFPRIRPCRSASSWVHSIYNSSSFVGLTFSIGGEQLFGLGWDKLRMYNVADRLGLTGWI